MLQIMADYLEQLADRHADIERAVSGLAVEALDWSPGPEMNSLAVLAIHTAGAERYWIGDVAMQDPLVRDRAAEFRMQGVEVDVIIGRLRSNLEYARRKLEGLALEELEATRDSLRDGKTYTVFWALAHALEHTATHAGHAQITRQLWDRRAG